MLLTKKPSPLSDGGRRGRRAAHRQRERCHGCKLSPSPQPLLHCPRPSSSPTQRQALSHQARSTSDLSCLPLSQPASRHSSLLLAPRHRHPLADLLLHPAAPDWVLLAFICVHRTTRALCGPCRRASRCRAARRRSSLALRSPGTAIPPRKRSSPASMWHDFHGRVKLRFCSGCAVLCQRDRGPPHRQPQRHREAVAHVDAEPTPSRGRFYAAGADARRADTHHCRSIGRLHRERRQRCQGQAEAVVAGTARRVLACRRAAGRWGGTAASSFHADVN